MPVLCFNLRTKSGTTDRGKVWRSGRRRCRRLRHLRLPLRQTFPRSVVPDFVRRLKQSTGIRNGSAAYRTAVQNGDMPEIAHVEEAAQRKIGTPKPAMNR